MPVFRKNVGQISAVDTENTRKFATVRIHVECVIGQIREKYQLLKKSVPMTFMMRKHNNVMAMDMIVFDCNSPLSVLAYRKLNKIPITY